MPLQLTDAQLDDIASKIYVLREPSVTKLPEPVSSTGADSLADALGLFGVPQLFPDVGLGVVLFPNRNPPGQPPDYLWFAPRIWLNNPGKAWRIASTSKIGMLLAAVQLREDVRAIQKLGVLHSPSEYDELFALKKLWARSKDVRAVQIAKCAPRISTIFTFPADGSPATFNGPDADEPDPQSIFNRLGPDHHLGWSAVNAFGFSELLWLTGSRSDNVAATSCVSELGVAYIKAVERAYGLFVDHDSNMRLLLGGGYTDVNTAAKVTNGSPLRHRPLQDIEVQSVQDAMKDPTGKYGDQQSWVGGSPAAMLAYLIALTQNRLAPSGHDLFTGETACNTIRANLAGGPLSFFSLIQDAVVKNGTIVTKAITKIGLLAGIWADFAYLETLDASLVTGDKEMAYGVVVTNISGPDKDDLALQIGTRIHAALKTL